MKYNQALLLYHIAAREEMIYQMMRDALIEASIVNEVIIAEAYEAISHIYDYHPDIIVSFLPRDEYSSALFTMVKMYYQCIWIAIPTEGFMEINPDQMRLLVGGNRQPQKLIDYYWFWGDGVAEAAKTTLMELKKITSTERVGVFGYLPYETDKALYYTKESDVIDGLFEHPSRFKKTVLVVTGIMSRDITLKEMIKESVVDPKQKEQVEDAKKLIRNNAWYSDKYIEAISNLAYRLPDFLFVIKIHPAEKSYLDYYDSGNSRYDMLNDRGNIVIIREPIPISVLMRKADCFIHYGSTTVLESYFYSLPSIGLRNTYEPGHRDATGTACMVGTEIIDVERTEHLCEAVEKAMFRRSDQMERALYDYVNYRFGQPYHPSGLLTDLFGQVQAAQEIAIKDKEVKREIWNKYCVYRRMMFLYEALRALLRGDTAGAKKRLVWLNCFWKRCIKSV